jgi:hypothetical protein
VGASRLANSQSKSQLISTNIFFFLNNKSILLCDSPCRNDKFVVVFFALNLSFQYSIVAC